MKSKEEYILSQHKVIHKVKLINPITNELFCKCGYHGYDYYTNILIVDIGAAQEKWHLCRTCSKVKQDSVHP